MAEPIKDGAKGNLAKVDDTLRLWTRSVSFSEQKEANEKGDAYNINTGTIELTDAVDTPILYFKNGQTMTVHITGIVVGFGPTTGGSGGIPVVTIVRNPTTGTIVSGATNVAINSNRNFGSSRSLSDSLAYKGATGDTMTDGTDHIISYQTTSGRLFLDIEELIPTGSSIGVKVAPQSGNTSMNVYAALICHLEAAE